MRLFEHLERQYVYVYSIPCKWPYIAVFSCMFSISGQGNVSFAVITNPMTSGCGYDGWCDCAVGNHGGVQLSAVPRELHGEKMHATFWTCCMYRAHATTLCTRTYILINIDYIYIYVMILYICNYK